MSPGHPFGEGDDLCLIDFGTLSIWKEREAAKTVSPSTAIAPKIMTIALTGVRVHEC